MERENTHTKERIRVRYEVAAIQGLTANPEVHKSMSFTGTSYKELIEGRAKHISTLAKAIADEMIKATQP